MKTKVTTPIRLVFTADEADALFALIQWARRQGYDAFTDHAKQVGRGQAARLMAQKVAVATCNEVGK